MQPPSPLSAQTDLASFTLTANGAPVADSYQIISLSVKLALNRIPSATIVMLDGSPETQDFPAASSRDFAPGTKIDISLGYHGRNTSVFTGIIMKSAIAQTSGVGGTLTVTCHDAAAALTIGRRSALYPSAKDSDVMTALISGRGLTADVAATPSPAQALTQFSATDWDFLLSHAEANGMIVAIAAGKVSIHPPALTAPPVLTITYGADLLEFQLEEDARTQLSSVTCTAWDPASQALATANTTARNGNPLGSDKSTALAQITGSQPFALNTPGPLSTAELKTWGDAQLLKSSLAKIRGNVSFQGSALAIPGCLLTLTGLGTRFDGNAYVSAVTHDMRDGNWTTTAAIGLDPAWFAARPDVSAPPAAALLPAVTGLQIGTVQQIDQDPDGQFRVLVNVPALSRSGGIRARLAQTYATAQAGACFYPEIGDEVVLAFLDGDPRFPIIIGSLFSTRHAPPFPPDAANTHKAIVTRAQLKLSFDDVKKSITIQTPGGNTIVLSDDEKTLALTDANGNAVNLSSTGITLKSTADIVIEAARNISLVAQAGTLTAKGTQAVTVSGLAITLNADTQLSATGNASASLKSSGQTVVQGAMVMIN